MNPFFIGVLAAIAVGMFVWFTVDTIKMLKRVKQLEVEKEYIRKELDYRLDGIIRTLEDIQRELSRRIDENYSYTDSRLDKLENKLVNKK